MRVLVLYAHPVETSFAAGLHATVVESLSAAGHVVDDCDLYAEGFDPVLSRAERLGYHEVGVNEGPVAGHVARLRAAEALVLCFPVWNFGFPAILKGYFDRVFLPGVSFTLDEDGRLKPALTHITRLVAVTTYGGTRLRALLAGDPPRRIVTRAIRANVGLDTPVTYLARYDMNRAGPAELDAFVHKVTRTLAAI